MKVSEIISEGKITQEGLKQIDQLISQNDALRKSYVARFSFGRYEYYSREDLKELKEEISKHKQDSLTVPKFQWSQYIAGICTGFIVVGLVAWIVGLS